jgi:gliding motility-associated-like protein
LRILNYFRADFSVKYNNFVSTDYYLIKTNLMTFRSFSPVAAMLFCLSLTLSFKTADASHAQGADFSYQCLGGNSYKISLSFFRDCFGISAPTSATVNLSSQSCGQNINVTLNPESSPVEVSSQFLCPSQVGQSRCASSSGSLPGTTNVVFSATVQLPAECSDWVVSYDLCCRNDGLSNLSSPGSQDLYVYSGINNSNSNALCNNSPVYSAIPIVYVCTNQPFTYNPGAVDVDGDSLVFTSINPLTGPGQNIPYVNPYNPNNPLATNPSGPFVLNPQTGTMTFNPSQVGYWTVTILVQEYRNGVLVGATIRDIQIVTVSCGSSVPPNVSNIDSINSGILVDSITIQACPGQLVEFTVVASDVAPDVLTLTTNVGTAIPNASYSVLGNGTVNIKFRFSWIPTVLDTGINFFSVTISDSLSCPIRSVITRTFTIEVLKATDAGPDLFFCPAGGPVQLQALGGTQFTWSPTTGLSDPNVANPLASPTVTTDYIVVSNLSSLCKNTDTVRVNVVPDFPYTLSPDTSICRNGSVQLEVNPTNPVFNPYQYIWSPANSLTNPILPNPIATPIVTTDYAVAVTAANGCRIRDTIRVTVSGVGPLVIITPDKNNVCPGETIQLNAGIYPLQCGQTISSCSAQNPPTFKTFGTGTATSNTGATPFQGTSQDSRTQILYRAADLNAAGINSGTIVGIRLNVGTWTSTRAYENFTIKMGCTNAGGLAVATGFVPTSTVVFGPTSITTQSGNNQFNFSSPYDWDGVSNLVIEICYDNNAQNAGGNDQVIVTTTTYSAMMRNYGDNTTGCSLNPAFVYSERPNTTFFICDPLPRTFNYTWVPQTGLSDPNILNPTVVLNNDIIYTLQVDDGQCYSTGLIDLQTDDSYSLDAFIDSNYACGDDSVQLHVRVMGTPPTNILPCGANGRTCSVTPALHTVGTGNTLNSNTSYPAPFGNWYESVKQQYLYRANELIASGMASGTLTSLAFNVSSIQGTTTYRNYTIKIGCTTLSSLNPNSFASGLTTVMNPRTVVVTTGWNNFQLDNTFDWDGTSNLIVEICFNNDLGFFSTDYTNNSISPGTNMGYAASIFARDDDADACPYTTPDGTSNVRPNTRFFLCLPPSVPTSIVWTPNQTLINPNTANPIAVPTGITTYTVSYTFANGCIKRDSVTVSPQSFDAVVSNDTAICLGSITTLAAFGGTNFTWAPATGLNTTNGAIVTASPTQTTTYFVTVIDSVTGCRDVDTVTVMVNPLPQIAFAGDSILCVQSITNLDAGAGFVSYNWSPNGETTQVIIAPTGFVYHVTVTDANGCVASDSIELREGTPPVIDIGADVAGCAGDTFQFNAGSGYASYLWNTNETDSVITVTQSGIYSVLIYDTAGCPGRDTAVATILSANLNLGNDTVLCAGGTLTLVAGQPGPDYLWSTSATTPSILVTTTDLYSVTVTVAGASTCTATDSIFVDIREPIIISIGPDTITCNGNPVVLDATNDFDSYLWSPGNQTTQTITVGVGGTYSVIVTDAYGCTGTDAVNLSDNNPEVFAGNDASFCVGQTATLTASSPQNVTYVWQPGGATTAAITVSAAGIYIVTGTDAAGCFDTDTVVVTVFAGATPNLGVDRTICSNESATLNPGNYDVYQWTGGATTPTLDVTDAGTYSVTVIDANGCSGTDAVVIAIHPPINLNIAGNTICRGSTTTISAPTGFVSYEWLPGNETTSSIDVNAEGEYILTVTDANGCSASDTAEITYYAYTVEATATPSTVDKGDTSQLNVTVTGGSGNYGYSWTPVDGLDNPVIQNPLATPLDTTTYTVTVTDLNTSCVAGTDTTTVVVIVESLYAVPDAFTPDGDGKNDVFKIYTAGNLTVREFKIYNRWGELVYNGTTGWDGNYKGEMQPVGTYVYYAVLIYPDGKPKTINNAFTLIR